MDINSIITMIITIGSIVLIAVAALVFITNIAVEVIKGLFPKIPTNIVAVVIAMTVTVLALLVLCSVLDISIMWYYGVGAVGLGLFVSYAAMFGFDKFKVAWEKVKEAIKQ